MFRNVFTKALWDRRRSTLWWMGGSVSLLVWIAGVYPIMRDSDAMQQFIEDFPPEMLAMFGIDPATYLTGAGFLHAQFFSLFGPFTMIALAIAVAVSATAGEERRGTLDMVLSAPVSRTSFMLQKVALLLTVTGSVAVVVAVTLSILSRVMGLGLTIEGVAAASASMWLLGVVFGGVALVVGAFTGSPSTTVGVGVTLSVVAWFANAFVAIFPWLEVPSAVSPFTWYLQGPPVLYGANSGQLWLALAGAGLAGASVVLFGRRNIATDRPVVPAPSTRRLGAATTRPRSTWLLGSVFGKSIWDKRRTVWWWALGLASLLLLTFAAWPTFSRDSRTVAAMIESMPKEVFALFGLTDTESLATAAGFISSRTYGSVGPIVMMVFAVGGVSRSIAGEESSGTMDLVLANPISRRRALIEKAAAIGVLAIFIGLLLTVFGLVGNAVYGTDLPPVNILTANLGLALLALCFGGVALAVWSLAGSGPAIGITAAIGVVAWFLNGLGAVVDVLAPLRVLSPFYWYLGDRAPLAKGFDPLYLLLLAVALAGTALAVWRFGSRDLAV